MSKIDALKKRIGNSSDPVEIMGAILDIFGIVSYPPIPGNYYTFVYRAKTPKLLYDQHPLIACLELEEWGFRGFNFHLNKHRNYTWPEVRSNICIVDNDEISFFRNLKYIKTRYNK
jgi:hypothetical protein